MIRPKVLPIQGSVKNYDWGKRGTNSFVYRFHTSNNQEKSSTIDGSIDSKPYAELWFGAHPSGHAFVTVNSKSIRLDNFLSKFPEMIGDLRIYKQFNKSLPFLLKILSVDKPLSLQAHPDKSLAKLLHAKDPKNYPDSNHKPELAIAITDFRILCDFKPLCDLKRLLASVGPIRSVVGENICDQFAHNTGNRDSDKILLSKCFQALMTSSPNVIQRESSRFIAEFERSEVVSKHIYAVIRQLASLHPGDPGVFAPIFLNYIELKPGQAVYLRPNKLHAYLEGDCIECMACSDNVVRAGLTHKYRDVETLIKMLDYECVASVQELILVPSKQKYQGSSIRSYAPTAEFKVDEIIVEEDDKRNAECVIGSRPSGSFVLVIAGCASTRDFFNSERNHRLSFGFSGFVAPKVDLSICKVDSKLVMYQAYC